MKCAVYIRVSTNHEEQTTSLQNQKEMFIKLIAEKGWELYKVYEDRGSGTHGKRDGLKELLKDAEQKKFDIVLAKELSRIARNAELSIKLRNIIMTNNIHLKTLDNAIDTLEGDFSKFGLYSWLYENESRRTSERIKYGQMAKANRGEFINGDPPYGYIVEKGILKIRGDETLNIVKEIFKMFLDGHGVDSIAKRLTIRGVQTPLQIKGKKNAGEKWHGSTIKNILKNRHYIGDLVQCRTTSKDITFKQRIILEPIIKENTHVAIISKEDFSTVQSLIECRKPFGGEGRATPKIHLFSDLLFCKDCGKKLWYMQNRKGYVCGTFRKYGKNFCSSHSVKEIELIDILKEDLKCYAEEIAINKETILEQLKEKVLQSNNSAKKAKEQLDKSNQKSKAQKGNLVLMYASGDIGKDEYELALVSLNNQLVQYQIKVSELNDTDTQIGYQTKLKYIETYLKQFMEFKEINREVLNRFVEKIVVDYNGDIEINYKFSI
jgi:DNA invertase Pin-like site-specific DNA recombinase